VNINHHLDQSTLLAFVAGTLSEALSAVAAAHISWCPECRNSARHAEVLGGELLSSLEGSNVSAACREQTLAQLGQAPLENASSGRMLRRGDVPAPLEKFIGDVPLQDLPWKRKAPGIAMHDLKMASPEGGRLLLMRIAAGKAMPEHGHGGEELTLILSGAYRDRIGYFGPGDVADLAEDIEHKPIVEPDAECFCLVATEAPTRFKSFAARLMQPLIGI
jgi:putative transcriptional regulator